MSPKDGGPGKPCPRLAVSASLDYLEPVDATAALADIRGFAAANRIVIVCHAWRRMAERGAQYEDVRHALACARKCRAADQGRWRVFGEDLDGDELVCVVAIEAGVAAVTVY